MRERKMQKFQSAETPIKDSKVGQKKARGKTAYKK
jgi:hypothetical protein